MLAVCFGLTSLLNRNNFSADLLSRSRRAASAYGSLHVSVLCDSLRLPTVLRQRDGRSRTQKVRLGIASYLAVQSPPGHHQ